MRTRIFKEKNYKSIYSNGKTLRIALDNKKPILKLDYPEFYDVKLTDYCQGDCPYCLKDDTIIDTIKKNKKIKDIKINERIFVLDTKNRDLKISTVSKLYKRKYNGSMIHIELNNGKTLELTPNHKIFTNNRGFVRADMINKKDDVYINNT